MEKFIETKIFLYETTRHKALKFVVYHCLLYLTNFVQTMSLWSLSQDETSEIGENYYLTCGTLRILFKLRPLQQVWKKNVHIFFSKTEP